MESIQSGSSGDDTSRLKKLCASKDAQCLALQGRIEILTDDITDLKADRAYLQEAARRCQGESLLAESRAHRWEQEARAAVARADEAERALIAAETGFAKDLDALRGLLRSADDNAQERGQTSASHRPEEDLLPEVPRSHAQTQVASSPDDASAEEAAEALAHANATRAACAALVHENAALRKELTKATSRSEALQKQLQAREELTRVTADRLQLAAREEVEQDELIERTEGELAHLQTRLQRPSVPRRGGESYSALHARGAGEVADAESITHACANPTTNPTSTRVARAHDSDAAEHEALRAARAVSPALRAASDTTEPSPPPTAEAPSAARLRWLRELESRTSPDARSHQASPPAVAAAREAMGQHAHCFEYSLVADGYARAPPSHMKTLVAGEGMPLMRSTSAMANGACRRPGAPPSVPATTSNGAYSRSSCGFTEPPTGLCTPTQGRAQEVRRGGGGYATHVLVQTAAERRTRDQIRALLVAKETALSAVAAL